MNRMSDDEREAYLIAHGWQFVGAGWIPAGGTQQHYPDGIVIIRPPGGGGLYSRSTAVREQLAREDPDAVPDELGHYYHGSQPDDGFLQRW